MLDYMKTELYHHNIFIVVPIDLSGKKLVEISKFQTTVEINKLPYIFTSLTE